jgi:hypothetical protein
MSGLTLSAEWWGNDGWRYKKTQLHSGCRTLRNSAVFGCASTSATNVDCYDETCCKIRHLIPSNRSPKEAKFSLRTWPVTGIRNGVGRQYDPLKNLRVRHPFVLPCNWRETSHRFSPIEQFLWKNRTESLLWTHRHRPGKLSDRPLSRTSRVI